MPVCVSGGGVGLPDVSKAVGGGWRRSSGAETFVDGRFGGMGPSSMSQGDGASKLCCCTGGASDAGLK
jgi:hypothetical protein